MHSPYGLVQFLVFEKFMSAYLFQIAREKSFDYLLITYKWQFLSRFGILCDKWATFLDEDLACEFKRKNSFTLSKSCKKTEHFLFTVKSSVYSQLNWRTWPQSKWKTPSSFGAAFLSTLLTVYRKLFSELWSKYGWVTKLKSNGNGIS